MLLWLLIMIPLLGGLMAMVIPEKIRKPFLVAVLLIEEVLLFKIYNKEAGLVIQGFTLVEGVRFNLRLDGLSFYMMTIATFMWLMALIYSFSYMRNANREPIFYTYMFLVLSALIGICLSSNLMVLYIFYELLTFSTFPLIIFRGTDEALRLGKKYLFYSFMGSTFLLVGMSIYFNKMGNLEFFAGKAALIPDHYLMVVSYLFIFLGFGVKSALVPFHSWLPSAMIAPTPVSALLHAVAVVKSGIFGLVRLTYYLFGVAFITGHPVLQKSLLLVITVSILTGAFLAYHQQNLKKRLAYSTISQLGYIMLGIVLGNGMALLGALLHLLNHAVIKMMLFFCVGSMYKDAGATLFKEINGLGKKMSFTFGVFLFSSISIMGLPPTNGFVSKWHLAIGAIDQGEVGFIAVILLSAFMTAIYLLPIGINAFFKPENQTIQVKKTDIEMKIPMLVLLIVSGLLGIFPNPVIHFLETHVITYLGL